MSNDVVDVALGAASPLLKRGYQTVDHRVYEQHFGSAWVLLVRGDVRIRIVNDRGLWFIEIGSAAATEEWFDARLVLMEVGVGQGETAPDYASLEVLCELLAEMAPKWEVLFHSTTFATARRSLRSRQMASATERFDLTS